MFRILIKIFVPRVHEKCLRMWQINPDDGKICRYRRKRGKIFVHSVNVSFASSSFAPTFEYVSRHVVIRWVLENAPLRNDFVESIEIKLSGLKAQITRKPRPILEKFHELCPTGNVLKRYCKFLLRVCVYREAGRRRNRDKHAKSGFLKRKLAITGLGFETRTRAPYARER